MNIRKEFDKEEFIKFYPVNSNQDTINKFNISLSTMFRRVKEYNIKKDTEYLTKAYSDVAYSRIEKYGVLKGELHPNWKGGFPWKRFANPEYINWRKSVLERDSYTCQHCFRVCKKSEKGLAAHHIKSYKDYIDLRYDINNGLTLCRECHMRVHGKYYTPKMIKCACGCGTLIPERRYKRKIKYVNGHYFKGRVRNPLTIEQKQHLSITSTKARQNKFWSTKPRATLA